MQKFLGKATPAFTLLETMIALLVFGLTLSLIQTELQQLPQVLAKTFVEEDIGWHLAVQQFEEFSAGATFDKCENNKVYFYQPAKKKQYRIEPYKKMIRLMGSKKGHMPLLTGVEKAKLTYQAPFVKLTATMTSGRNYQSEFYLPPAEEKHEKAAS
ncbi:competence type IV pilus minor pilin ComGF [Loigolactobacillus zhaoyuanensis]|uniref:Competence type IV pilus minor pilin ComGF n=1 Tax=Loigolactobacillus zhaoyuanensis TaxID=2486017 RepID=A0ABW8UCL2_9LACO|nr:competence type IV pilus minor pilin ComGF [Loigolactobacillus zhaoyuanensis]